MVSNVKSHIIFVADFFSTQILGGAEMCDSVLLTHLENTSEMELYSSKEFNKYVEMLIGRVMQDSRIVLVFSNFTLVESRYLQIIAKHLKNRYCIVERDNKFVRTRNLANYPNFLAPSSEVVHSEFYTNAKHVFGMCTHHTNLIKHHLPFANVTNIGCAQFSEESLKFLNTLTKNSVQKLDKYCVISGKGQQFAERICKSSGYEYDVLPKLEYFKFLEELSKYKGIVFISHAVESFCRLLVEARVLNLQIVTDHKNGVAYEDWFKINKGTALLEVLEEKVQNSLNILESHITNS